MKVLQSVQIFKIGKWLEMSVLRSPDVKKLIFSPWFLAHTCTYIVHTYIHVCVYYVCTHIQYEDISRTVCPRAMKFGKNRTVTHPDINQSQCGFGLGKNFGKKNQFLHILYDS
jgi:hypothetical protein